MVLIADDKLQIFSVAIIFVICAIGKCSTQGGLKDFLPLIIIHAPIAIELTRCSVCVIL